MLRTGLSGLIGFCLIALCCVNPICAEEEVPSEKNAKFILQCGMETGGDKMVTVYFVGGDSADIKAGDFLNLSLGAAFKTMPEQNDSLETQLTVGYKFKGSKAENGEVKFSRFPVELLQFYSQNRWRVGGGLTHHINPKLTGSGVMRGLDVSFDDATGLIMQAGYVIDQMTLDLRYTAMNYSVGSIDVDADCVGIMVGARF